MLPNPHWVFEEVPEENHLGIYLITPLQTQRYLTKTFLSPLLTP